MTMRATTPTPSAWAVTARNLPEHANNRIHTDEGAREQGFPRALVAGVTTYAYLTRPVVDHWGLDWVAGGAASLRLLSPVFADDALQLVPSVGDADALDVAAETAARGTCATMRAWPSSAAVEAALRDERDTAHEVLPVMRYEMSGEWADYGLRAGEDFAGYAAHGIVHPAVWPGLANHVTHAHVVRGAWVHTNSLILHHRTCEIGATVRVECTVVRRWPTSRGERAALSVRIIDEATGDSVATLRHEALVSLNGA